MGFTTRVKSEASEKKPFNFALFWDKYGTFFILAIIVAIFGSLSPEYFLTTNNITQIFVQSSVTVLIGMGEFFAILVAGIDLSVGAILALSGMVTAKLMLAGVDPFLAALIGGVLVGGALGAINGCLVNWGATPIYYHPWYQRHFPWDHAGDLRCQLGIRLLI